ncbi:hypothetical protein J2S43_008241 [Catenuloplanes nepalensis]|uniref:Uncharacterized protein n=1 Tax=Catenuloplanes nepalensis TaxID=587533 RepID=A0ABT9N7Q5_9ACTN|nr:DUF6082 family protein [Catenuloplanes nepalensis]MDP9799729.1 hypothetical protein [Catenuloplanes nepalensis]
MVAMLGRGQDALTWARWGDVGDAFGVVNSVASTMAVAALATTWILQTRDLRDQRAESAVQRTILERAESALQRSADIDLRKLHMDLIHMAIDTPHLARVWPHQSGVNEMTQSQHMYANLLIQHAWLQHTTNIASREEMISNVRYLFASPAVRAFWKETVESRESIYEDYSAATLKK